MNIGVEIEFTGVRRKTVALELAKLWDSEAVLSEHKGRECYYVKDDSNRTWMIYDDRSISPVMPEGGVDSSLYRCEVASPVLRAGRFQALYEVLSVILSLDGVVNHTCGIHMHVDWPRIDKLVEILSEVMSQQSVICNKFGVSTYRRSKYCKLYDEEFIKDFENNKASFSSVEDVLSFFTSRLNEGFEVYDTKAPMRYYIVNLANAPTLGTLEFRFFQSTLSFDVIQLYKNWVMQMTL